MIDLTDIKTVKEIIANMRSTFETPQGKETMANLEEMGGWYESIFDPQNRDMILINAGKREFVATIKTFLKYSPEEIVRLAQQKEQNNG